MTDHRPNDRPITDAAEHPLYPMNRAHRRAMRVAQLSRRRFIAQSGGLSALALGGQVAAQVATPVASPSDVEETGWPSFEGVPDTPHEPPPAVFQALTDEEARAVEALTARLVPGTPDDPGAREAGVVYYIDYLLSQNEGIVEATYRVGPFARGYEGDEEPAPEEGVVWVPADQLSRYGYQSPLTPLRVYQIGLAALDSYADSEHSTAVGDLDDEQIDELIWAMLRGEIEQFTEFSSYSFFQTLRMHTAEGMFSDPGYGGNRDLIGWRLVGFPGAQRSYSPQEMQTEQPPREPQSMHNLPEFAPGHTEDGPVLPVRGTDPVDSDGHDGHGGQ